jgi:hypothetical protein
MGKTNTSSESEILTKEKVCIYRTEISVNSTFLKQRSKTLRKIKILHLPNRKLGKWLKMKFTVEKHHLPNRKFGKWNF